MSKDVQEFPPISDFECSSTTEIKHEEALGHISSTIIQLKRMNPIPMVMKATLEIPILSAPNPACPITNLYWIAIFLSPTSDCQPRAHQARILLHIPTPKTPT
jgi:hypothetical protein